jgi:3-deoxy-D-manno-octulosonic-acid transferase
LIIAPHEPTAGHLDSIEGWAASRPGLVARLGSADRSTDVVVVDRVGVLGDLYALADVAFVGGGFHDAGLHSVLEPAAYGVPVAFGPRHRNSREAALLIKAGGADAIGSSDELTETIVHWLSDPAVARSAGAQARAFVESGAGATGRSVAMALELMAGAPASHRSSTQSMP